MTFGEHIKQLRISRGLGLRAFCIAQGVDASNWSRIERGRANPSYRDMDTIICAFGLNESERQELHDLADVQCGTIPADLLDDDEVVKKLPVFFHGARDPETLNAIVELIRKNG